MQRPKRCSSFTSRSNDNFQSIFYSMCLCFSPGPKSKGDSSRLNHLSSLSHISKHFPSFHGIRYQVSGSEFIWRYICTAWFKKKRRKKVARQHNQKNLCKICRKLLILILLIYSFGQKTWNKKNIGKIKRNLLPRLALFGYILSSRGLTDKKKKLFRIILQINIIDKHIWLLLP